jgi:hypothetical protein
MIPDYEVKKLYQVEVKVVDGGGLEATTIANVHINDINEAPVYPSLAINMTTNNVGTVPAGTTCAIPFSYEGVTYYDCIEKSDSAFGGYGWCSTTAVFKGSWGGCEKQATVTTSYAANVPENSNAGTKIGLPFIATDSDAYQKLDYTIIAGNENGIFAIDACSGQLEISDGITTSSNTLNYEASATKTFTITMKATDNGQPTVLSDTVIVNIAVTDVNEPPFIVSNTFHINENAPSGTIVGTIAGTDPEANPLTYSIDTFTTTDVFEIINTNQIATTQSSTLDY